MRFEDCRVGMIVRDHTVGMNNAQAEIIGLERTSKKIKIRWTSDSTTGCWSAEDFIFVSDPSESINPYRVGDVVHGAYDKRHKTIAALGNKWGANKNTAVTYTTGGWDPISSLTLVKRAGEIKEKSKLKKMWMVLEKKNDVYTVITSANTKKASQSAAKTLANAFSDDIEIEYIVVETVSRVIVPARAKFELEDYV